MNGLDCLSARTFSKTENQAVLSIKPVGVVLHSVLLLYGHVQSMGIGDCLRRGPRNIVAINVNRHRNPRYTLVPLGNRAEYLE